MGGALTAIDAFQQGNSASKASVKVGASVVAGGAGYYTVAVILVGLGITPVGWVGAIGLAATSTIMSIGYNAYFNHLIENSME